MRDVTSRGFEVTGMRAIPVEAPGPNNITDTPEAHLTYFIAAQ